ncbi:calcium-binding protein [Variovorax sp. WS11]|uniref:beta strand repeat-containing protein n=1 Tax=Variovorax sp. WS11 TaxID=1105204 RepID=UPI000D0CC303|nr:ESPR-type extended signal peptide-containing protein [Variovorax sp. WS11]NDZ13478.1 calcium-binding protein [Variovorax sp. WS11]PSL84416.1 calcium-binding protein [Variovorax sp. WS11]
MNQSYLTVWNEAIGAWVAASEITSARGKRGGSRVANAGAGVLASLRSGPLRAGIVTALLALGGLGWSPLVQAQAVTCDTAPWDEYNGTASCMGAGAIATGQGSTALGSSATVDTNGGVAVGFLTHTTGVNAIAIGYGAFSTGTNSIYLGARTAPGTGALGEGAIGIGTDVTSSGDLAIAVGLQTKATGDRAVSLGLQANAAGLRSIAIGNQANATVLDAIAQGNSASAGGQNAIAIGFQTIASKLNSVYLGSRTAAGTGATAISAIGIGTDVTASQEDAIAIGRISQATGADAIALGQSAASTDKSAIAIGRNSTSSAVNAITLGVDTDATATNAVAISALAQATGLNALAIGTQANATADNAIALGTTAVANSADAVAIGNGSTATGGRAVAIGAGNFASGNGAVAIGDPNTATGNGAIAQGLDNTATGNGSVAMGNTNMVGGGGQAVGVAGTAAQGAVGIGYQNTVVGQGSVAIGSTSSALAAGAVAFGDTAVANNAGDVALGSGSTTAAAVGTAGTVIGGTPYTFEGTTPTSTVSVGAPGAERTITNVAAGRISNTSTDAINGSQLWATNQQVTANTTAITDLGNTIGDINAGAGIKYFHASSTLPDSQALGADSVAIGPNAVANNAGDIALGFGSTTAAAVGTPGTVIGGTPYTFQGTTPTSTVSVGAPGAERTITNVAAGRISNTSTDVINGSQLWATNQQVTANTTAITNLGNTIGDINAGAGIKYFHASSTLPDSQALGTDSIAVGPNAVANGASSIAQGLGASATVDGSVALGSASVSDRAVAGSTGDIPAGSSLIPYNTTDRTLLGAVSVGSATTYRQITNVADGTEAQDAVTVRQLSGALQSFAVTPIQYFHANSTAMDSLAIGAESVAVGPRTVVNGDSGVGIGNGAVVQQTAPGGVAIGQGATSHRADSVAIGTQSSAAAVQGVAIGAGSSVTQAGGVALGAGSVASTAAGAAGYVPTGASTSQTAAINATTSTLSAVSVGDAANGQFRQITGVAAGSLDSDAVNVSQLKAVQTTVASIDQSAVKYETNADGTTNYNSVKLGGTNTNAPVTLHNVADGVAGNDAVNVNQLRSASAASAAYTDARVNALGNELHGVARNAYAGVAAAMAVQMPGSYVPGKTVMRLGYGIFKGESAVGVSFRRTAENNGWSVTGGVGLSRAGPAATVGAEWVFN